jgi:predicted O-methyltransferase YrrM
MNITQFLNSHGFDHFEGYTQQDPYQTSHLANLIKSGTFVETETQSPSIRNVMEIGFNAGHSAEIFLSNNKEIKLTSFDIGHHPYIVTAKEYIDMTYPGRHTLIIGDSRNTIPSYINSNPNARFDLIFIDGGHDYEIAKADLDNCSRLAHKETIVILDDTVFTNELETDWTIGPTRTWNEHLSENKIVELNRFCYGRGRGMSWGKYLGL